MRKHGLKFFLLFPLSVMLLPAVIALCGTRAPELPRAAENIVAVSEKKAPQNISILCEDGKTVKTVDIEDYLPGVVAAEMPAAYEEEALKAQAVAARSYILSRAERQGDRHPTAAVCSDPSHCKAWLSEEEAKAKWQRSLRDAYWKKIKKAVDDTCGEYMVYDGETVEAFFFARSGGRTESSADVWGGDRPYLQSVESEGDILSPDLESTVWVSADEFWHGICALDGTAVRCDPIQTGELRRTEGGGVAAVGIGGREFRGADIRRIFGLKSANFTIVPENGGVRFDVRGYGHGVGMSQFGANYMAKNGKKYTEILEHYYTNIQIVKN